MLDHNSCKLLAQYSDIAIDVEKVSAYFIHRYPGSFVLVDDYFDNERIKLEKYMNDRDAEGKPLKRPDVLIADFDRKKSENCPGKILILKVLGNDVEMLIWRTRILASIPLGATNLVLDDVAHSICTIQRNSNITFVMSDNTQ